MYTSDFTCTGGIDCITERLVQIVHAQMSGVLYSVSNVPLAPITRPVPTHPVSRQMPSSRQPESSSVVNSAEENCCGNLEDSRKV